MIKTKSKTKKLILKCFNNNLRLVKVYVKDKIMVYTIYTLYNTASSDRRVKSRNERPILNKVLNV